MTGAARAVEAYMRAFPHVVGVLRVRKAFDDLREVVERRWPAS